MSSDRGTSYDDIEAEQRALCADYRAPFQQSAPGTKVGIALETLTHIPINGFRHPPDGETNGWYIWGGKELSTSPDFFQPLHTEHLVTRLPHILKFLGLPPGYRFLVAGDYVDVWFDRNLLR